MKSVVILILVGALVSLPLVHSTGPTQPPVLTNTLYVGANAWGPMSADPCSVYDSESGRLLFNVYDTLIQNGNASLGSYETYWNFLPVLSSNVPDRQTVTVYVPSEGIDPAAPMGYSWTVDSAWYRIESWTDNGDQTLSVGDTLYVGEYQSQGSQFKTR